MASTIHALLRHHRKGRNGKRNPHTGADSNEEEGVRKPTNLGSPKRHFSLQICTLSDCKILCFSVEVAELQYLLVCAGR
uniref:Uncharacterized protein n=1 Tax=Arundo donax TaxID=35708 RepID=A0A0A9H8P4_ARUDO